MRMYVPNTIKKQINKQRTVNACCPGGIPGIGLNLTKALNHLF
jgi:hypothetical protein